MDVYLFIEVFSVTLQNNVKIISIKYFNIMFYDLNIKKIINIDNK